MERIRLVDWDVDQVWYSGTSTSYCAEQNPGPYQPHVDRLASEGILTPARVEQWANYAGKDLARPFRSIGDVAQCMTDLFYKVRDGDKPVLAKEEVIRGKQSLLGGMTLDAVYAIADRVPRTTGLSNAISTIRGHDVYQVACSDGLGPFIHRIAQREGVNEWRIVPAIVNSGGQEIDYCDGLDGSTTLTGKVRPFSKADAFEWLAWQGGVPLNQVAVIDDSFANVPFLRRIHELGGLAVGFNVKEREAFQRAGVPILRGNDLEAFREIVLDRSKLGLYTE